jgi:chaperonin GroEL
VLGDLKVNWDHPKSTVKVVPLLSPPSILDNGRKQFLLDLQAYTGAPVFDPISKPLTELNPITLMAGNRATYFECTRFRSSVVVNEDEALIDARVEELKHQLKKPESQYEENELNVRIGKLTSGIARLTISAPSSGESREKRDRAEDAWMAIRAAIKHGAVPGGGFTLVKASADMVALSLNCQDESTKIALDILADALVKPVEVLYGNYGYSPEDTHKMVLALFKAEEQTFDIAQQQWVNKNDLLDSLPAVTEAIRSSISVAGLLATVGGIIAFSRNAEADAEEQKYARRFEEAINTPLE